MNLQFINITENWTFQRSRHKFLEELITKILEVKHILCIRFDIDYNCTQRAEQKHVCIAFVAYLLILKYSCIQIFEHSCRSIRSCTITCCLTILDLGITCTFFQGNISRKRTFRNKPFSLVLHQSYLAGKKN